MLEFIAKKENHLDKYVFTCDYKGCTESISVDVFPTVTGMLKAADKVVEADWGYFGGYALCPKHMKEVFNLG